MDIEKAIPNNPKPEAHAPFCCQSRINSILLVPVLILTAILVWIASYIKIDYYDSFLIMLNARCIATADILGYSGSRPIILPIVLSPIFLFEKLLQNRAFVFPACHAFMIGFFIVLLWAAYRLFRLRLGRRESLIGILLMSFNRGLVHAAPFCKEDVFAACILTAGFYFYLKATRKKYGWSFLAAGACFALAIGARYNFPILFLILALYEFIAQNTRFSFSISSCFLKGERIRAKLFFLFAFPIALFILILSWHYSALGISSFWGATHKYVTEPMAYMANLVRVTYPLPPRIYFEFLIQTCTIPILLLAGLGLVKTFQKPYKEDWFFALWLAVFLVLHAFLVPQKEARFLIPIFVPLYYFAAAGLGALLNRIRASSMSKRLQAFAKIGIIVAALALPLKGVAAEIVQFRDPVYRVDFVGNISTYATQLAGNHDIHWIGPFYPVHPKDHVFHIEDVTYYVHHLYWSAILLRTERVVNVLQNAQFIMPKTPGGPIFVGPKGGAVLDDGEVLIINTEKEGYNTKSMPKELAPLYIERVRKTYFEPVGGAAPNAQMYESRDFPGARIEIHMTENGFSLKGSHIPNGLYEVYFDMTNPAGLVPLLLTNVTDGTFSFSREGVQGPIPAGNLYLLYFDSVKTFALPRED